MDIVIHFDERAVVGTGNITLSISPTRANRHQRHRHLASDVFGRHRHGEPDGFPSRQQAIRRLDRCRCRSPTPSAMSSRLPVRYRLAIHHRGPRPRRADARLHHPVQRQRLYASTRTSLQPSASPSLSAPASSPCATSPTAPRHLIDVTDASQVTVSGSVLTINPSADLLREQEPMPFGSMRPRSRISMATPSRASAMT